MVLSKAQKAEKNEQITLKANIPYRQEENDIWKRSWGEQKWLVVLNQ